MKNKRYKRIAKRLRGNCLRNIRKNIPCIYCKEHKTCIKYLGVFSPCMFDKKTLEEEIRWQ